MSTHPLLRGKVPGFSAKTVHFPPWPAGVPALQTSLAPLAVSTLGESAGLFRENGSLSPVACRGTGSTDPSRRTCRFHPRGKCREFLRKWCTFPPWRDGVPALQTPLAALTVSTSRESAGFSCENGSLSPGAVHFPRGWRLLRRSSRACFGKCLVSRHSEKGHLLDLG